MLDLLAAIKDWPVIVQGALGSALFALTFKVAQRALSWILSISSTASGKRRLSYLLTIKLRLEAVSTKDHISRTFYTTMLWHRASRDVIRGLIWLTLGLVTSSFVSVFGIIGYLGCLYYLFFALEVVKPVALEGKDAQEHLKEVNDAIEILKRKLDA